MRFVKYLLVFIPFLAVFLMSQNTFAERYPVSSFGLYGQKYYGNANGWETNLGYSGTTMHSVYRWEVWISNLSQSQTGKYGSVNLSGIINYPPDFDVRTDQGFSITQCYIAGTGATLSNVRTSWALGDRNIIWAAEAQLEFPTNTLSGNMFCTFQSNNGQYFLQHITNGYGQVTFGTTNFNATFSNNLSDELLQQQITQNQTIINQNQAVIDQNNSAYDAISGQSENDISGATNGQTTNLINIITSFFNELSSFSASDCNLNLPLPSFIGGNTSVNICQGKDVLGNFITLISTLTVLMFYIPLAWILLKMIYNEIRSWTNG